MTTLPRLYVTATLSSGTDLPATPAQAHHLGNVLRRRPGEQVRLFNGRDGEWLATILTLRGDRATFGVTTQARPQIPDPDLWLVFALLKRDATDLVIQKATELGAAALHPVFTDRTNVARMNLNRAAAIATEAAEQCERLTIPVIHPPRRLTDVLATWPPNRRLFAAIERADAAPLRPAHTPAALLVGPEGGFTPNELDVMRRHPLVTPVSLGPRVLRADTACLAGLALLQAPGCG